VKTKLGEVCFECNSSSPRLNMCKTCKSILHLSCVGKCKFSNCIMILNATQGMEVDMHQYSTIPILCLHCQLEYKMNCTQTNKYCTLETNLYAEANRRKMAVVKRQGSNSNLFMIIYQWFDFDIQVSVQFFLIGYLHIR
jgi:hypothetical protein